MASGDGDRMADWGGGPDAAASRDGGEEESLGDHRPANQDSLPAPPHGPDPRSSPPLSTIIGPKGQVGVLAQGGGLNNTPVASKDAWNLKRAAADPAPESNTTSGSLKKRGPGRPRGRSSKKPPPKVKGLMLDLRRRIGEVLAKNPSPSTLLALTKCVVLLAQLEGARISPNAEVRADKRTGTPPVVKKRRGRAKPNLAPSFEDELAEDLEND